jgi:hypothetical protein
MLNDNDLKDKIFVFVDRIRDLDREDTRAAIFDFVKELFDDRAQNVPFGMKDLDEIRNAAIKSSQDLSSPHYVDLQRLDSSERIAFCYLQSIMMFLRKRNLIKYLLDIDTRSPFIYSIHEE